MPKFRHLSRSVVVCVALFAIIGAVTLTVIGAGANASELEFIDPVIELVGLTTTISSPFVTECAMLVPTLGNYPNISIPLSTNTTVTPDAPPTNTTSINVSSSTNFNGRLSASST